MTQSAHASYATYPEAVALRALGFFGNGRRVELDRYLEREGLGGEVRTPPVRREVLSAVLDFLVTNEAALILFAHAVDLPPEAAYEARRKLD
jgi:hypothetical protein